MGNKEIEAILAMTYYEMATRLLEKYSAVKYDYFTDETCKESDRRGIRYDIREQLIRYHVHENKELRLSDPDVALKYPWTYQRAEWLLSDRVLSAKAVKNQNAFATEGSYRIFTRTMLKYFIMLCFSGRREHIRRGS